MFSVLYCVDRYTIFMLTYYGRLIWENMTANIDLMTLKHEYFFSVYNDLATEVIIYYQKDRLVMTSIYEFFVDHNWSMRFYTITWNHSLFYNFTLATANCNKYTKHPFLNNNSNNNTQDLHLPIFLCTKKRTLVALGCKIWCT